MPRGRLALSSEQETPQGNQEQQPAASSEAAPPAPAAEQASPSGGPGGPGGARGGRGGGRPGGGRGGRGGPGGRGGRGGRPGGRPGGRDRGRDSDRDVGFVENVVRINRSAAVVKGGRRFSFSALVVVGDGNGNVGIGYGKANGVPNAVEKGVKDARKHMFKVPIVDGTIPHPVIARYQASKVILEPASPGTGVVAGASVRAVVEAAGIHNILTKCHGSVNPVNVVKAVEAGLRSLMTRDEVLQLRGVELDEDAGTWKLKAKGNPKKGRKAKKVTA
jgi:small subunit ribosomal protein S5